MYYAEPPGYHQQIWALQLFATSRRLQLCWSFLEHKPADEQRYAAIPFVDDRDAIRKQIAKCASHCILWLEAALSAGDENFFPAGGTVYHSFAPGCMHRWDGCYPVKRNIPDNDHGSREYAALMVAPNVVVGGDCLRDQCVDLPLATQSAWAQKWRKDSEHEAKRELCKDLVSGSKTWAFLQPLERADIANVWLPELNSGWVWEIENPDGSGMQSPMSCKAYVASGRATSLASNGSRWLGRQQREHGGNLAWYLRTRQVQLDLWLEHTYEERWNLKLDSLLWQPDHSVSQKPWQTVEQWTQFSARQYLNIARCCAERDERESWREANHPDVLDIMRMSVFALISHPKRWPGMYQELDPWNVSGSESWYPVFQDMVVHPPPFLAHCDTFRVMSLKGWFPDFL